MESSYFDSHYRYDPKRSVVWTHIADYLSRWIPPDAALLELGAGYCDLSNRIRAATKVAMDIDPTAARHAAPEVRVEIGDCADLSRFDEQTFDVVVASNLLEHLERRASQQLVRGVRSVLVPGGRFILLQPNFRLRPREYFDDYTHVQIFTDRSLAGFLTSEGYTVEHVVPRFLPLTMKSRLSRLTFLVPLYLRLPMRPLAGQMLVVASRREPGESTQTT